MHQNQILTFSYKREFGNIRMLDKIIGISTKINFEGFDCFELVKCVFNLNNTDLMILQSFPKNHQGITINDLTEIIGKDRSIIYRSLEKLTACQICFKERRSGKSRGFVDFYFRIPMKDIFKKAEENLDRCYKNIKKIIADLQNSDG
jgi:predicted transcriptional regulator